MHSPSYSTLIKYGKQIPLTVIRTILIHGQPITSSRGAANTTADRIYFSTPSAEVRIPVGDLIFPAPTSAHTILLAGKICGGGKTV